MFLGLSCVYNSKVTFHIIATAVKFAEDFFMCSGYPFYVYNYQNYPKTMSIVTQVLYMYRLYQIDRNPSILRG